MSFGKWTYGAVIAGVIQSGFVGAAQMWKGEAELGVVNTTGNTETQKINAKGKIINEREKWRHTLVLEALRSGDDDTTSAERYLASGKSDYKFSEFSYIFAILGYEDDRFSGYDYRASAAVGYGRRVLDRDNLMLDLEFGPGMRRSKVESSGDVDTEGMLRAAGSLDWIISQTTKLNENLTVEAGEDATISKSVTSLTTQIAGNLASKLSFTVKNTSDVSAGVKKTDTESGITLVYSF